MYFSHDARVVEWKADFRFARVRLELYRAGEYVETIVADHDNTGAYYWVVPEELQSHGGYQIKVIDPANQANYCYSGYFRIVGKIAVDDEAPPDPNTPSRAWSIETVETGSVGYYSSIDVDSNNRPHISYYDSGSDDLKYAYWDGAVWQIQTIDASGDVGRWTSIGVDKTNDHVHISYTHEGNRDLKYAYWNGSVWDIAIVDDAGNRGEYTSLALDSNGDPHVSYIYGGSGDLLYARKISGMWFKNTVDDESDTGRYTAIATDNNDYPHISYHDYTWNRYWCKYAYYNGSTWPELWVDQRTYAGYYTSVTTDDSNLPHISYQGISNCDYAHWTGGTWQLLSLDPDGGNLSWAGTSILLDQNGYPHIAYYRTSSASLWHAEYTGTTWHMELVDDAGSVGGNCSMVLDDAGFLHISYVDYTNGALKYATRELTSVHEDKLLQKEKTVLQITPNPCRGERISISYGLQEDSHVHMVIYNTLGQAVKTLVKDVVRAGQHVIGWDRTNNTGARMPAGVYLLRLSAENDQQTAKILLVE
jgi:hypothetical protein